MTSPIKPPGGPKPPGAPDPATSGKPAGAEFSESMAAEQVGDVTAEQTSSAASVDAVSQTAADLKSGAIDAAAALERVIAAALSAPEAQLLDESGRAQLEAHLRATLEDDPALVQLVRDLERAS